MVITIFVELEGKALDTTNGVVLDKPVNSTLLETEATELEGMRLDNNDTVGTVWLEGTVTGDNNVLGLLLCGGAWLLELIITLKAGEIAELWLCTVVGEDV